MQHNHNQMRLNPDSVAQEAAATLTTGTYFPMIAPLKLGDGVKSLAEIIEEKTGGETEADVYLFIVPKDGGATPAADTQQVVNPVLEGLDDLPTPKKDFQYNRALKMKYLRDRRYTYREIANIMGLQNHATVLLTLKRYGLWEPTHCRESD
ncbi:hypothetical protein [Shewanella indica]|uniref:hypothetical protein n=1 Tax=Shewanella indica TaxID=768528 RepID=UPI0020444C49|nr:hypothetical protein [Shewanella indica]